MYLSIQSPPPFNKCSLKNFFIVVGIFFIVGLHLPFYLYTTIILPQFFHFCKRIVAENQKLLKENPSYPNIGTHTLTTVPLPISLS